ncbi:MAG TPA: hypothetical protein QGF58_25950 [Myxococcota bacterium]|nr:hypothetical protein [Myxococcota bacterium]
MVWLLACTGSDPDDTPDSTADTHDSVAEFTPPDWCPAPESGRQDVTTTDGSPYYVQHPEGDGLDAPIVVFLPGGNGKGGANGHATASWGAFFDGDPRGYRLVMPYVEGNDYPQTDVPDVEAVLDEVLACFGGDGSRVHLAGHSNGGYLAYNVVGPDLAERFLSITGAPAYFVQFKSNKLEGLAFHNSAGETDTAWLGYMEDAHAQLEDAGFESELTVWPGEGHTPSASWDGRDGMFAFWDEHQ